MSSRRTGIIRLAMLLALLLGFLAMHGMSATTAGAGHHGATTLASPHSHHVSAENPGFLPASSDGIAPSTAGALTGHTAEPSEDSEDGAVTTGCVVALAGLLGLLAFLARLRKGRRGHSRRGLAEQLINAVAQRSMHPPPQPRLHISLCILRV